MSRATSSLQKMPTRALMGDPTVTGTFQPMRFHFFISHMQVEASGDVGTLFHLFGSRGMHCWRDMNLADDITETAMKQGVADSAVFLLFLTNRCSPLVCSHLCVRPPLRIDLYSTHMF